LYLRAAVRGLVQTPPILAEMRREIEAIDDLHRALTEVDPALAARLHPNDRLRLIRGVEVFRQTGQQLSALQAAHALAPDRIATHGIKLDHEALDARIDQRVHTMIEEGYVNEVRGLLERGFGRQLKPMTSLGYRHMCSHVLDDVPLDEAIRCTQRDTRRFARKQRTWGKAFNWPKVSGPTAIVDVIRAAEASFSPAG
jgi:tRNA dimethylallyltransferase